MIDSPSFLYVMFYPAPIVVWEPSISKYSNYFSLFSALGTHLFVMVPRPGDNEGTFSVFKSSCHLLLPV